MVGGHQSRPGGHHLAGTARLDAAGRLDEFYWQRLSLMLALTERSTSDTWVGFAWRGRCEVRCEAQRDDGYGGVLARLVVPESWAARVEEVVAGFRPG